MTNRISNLDRLKRERFDVCVIGGGATGAGIALDAASRGLRTALVEMEDFSFGTSSRSTKLIHGGVRYLENAFLKGDFAQLSLVRQSLWERSVLLKTAPHLVKPLPIVIPLYSWLSGAYYFLGITVYDLLAGKKKIGRSGFLSREEVIRNFPSIERKGLKGGIQYYDAQFDDARMNLALILTAIEKGAAAVNYAEAIGFGPSYAKVKDRLSGEVFEVKAKVIVNASGPLSDQVRRLNDRGAESILTASSGIHLVLDQCYTPCGKGLLIPKTTDRRVLFLLPWQGAALIGTTDVPARAVKDPKPTEEEVGYLISQLKQETGIKIERDAVKACWAGIRPLVSEKGKKTSRLSRDFKILKEGKGFYSIVGGKWTTYRKMAEELVDHICEEESLSPEHPCMTETISLFGASGDFNAISQTLLQEYALDKEIASHLLNSYGGQAVEVAKLSKDFDGLKRLKVGFPYLRGEVVYAARNEMACTASDVLSRRLRLGMLDSEAAQEVLPEVVELLSKELEQQDIGRQRCSA